MLNVIVSVEATPGPVLAGENAWATVGGIGVTVSAVGQALALVPAEVGALLVALPEATVMVAVSVAPALSLTVSVTVPEPDTVAVSPVDGVTVAPPAAAQEYEAKVRPQEAALPLAFNELPPVMATAAMGANAARTAE